MTYTNQSYRCSDCDRNWPLIPVYNQCPICGEHTWKAEGEDAMPLGEAKKLREAYDGFRAYCAKEGLDVD